MILPVTEVDSIKHIQKAHTSHITAFESIFDKVERQEKERKERAKKQREKEKKDAIDRKRKKQQEERKKREAAKRALEEQRRAEEASRIEQERAAADAERARREQSDKVLQESRSGVASTWAEVSPEAAANYMAAHTGVPASRWLSIIYHESTNNPTVTNSIGCFGYLQLHPVHGAVSQMTPQQYLDTAVSVFNSQGLSAWEVITMGKA